MLLDEKLEQVIEKNKIYDSSEQIAKFTKIKKIIKDTISNIPSNKKIGIWGAENIHGIFCLIWENFAQVYRS